MGIVVSVLALLGLIVASGDARRSRAAELHDALDQALMLEEAARRGRDPDLAAADAGADAGDEIERDLVYMELDAGFLAGTCVSGQERVFALRLMIATARLLRMLGRSDREIVEHLVASAGERGAQVRRFLDFAGVDGISHFICVDYLRAALAKGLPDEVLREYVARVGATH